MTFPTSIDPTPKTTNTWQPGYFDPNNVREPFDYQWNWNTWKKSVVEAMAQNIISGQGAGYPGGWDFESLGRWDQYVGIGGKHAPSGLIARIGSYLDNYQPGMSTWIDRNFPMPPKSTAEYVETPEHFAFRVQQENADREYALDVDQHNFNKAKFFIEMAVDNAQRNVSSSRSSGIRVPSTSSRSSGSSRSGGGGNYSYSEVVHRSIADPAALAVEQEKIAAQKAMQELETQLALGELDLKRLQAEADNRYKEALIQNMQAQQDISRQRLGLDRASILAGLAANPGDAVQREYVMRTGQEPVGTAVNAFTGEADTSKGVTLSEVMKRQAPLLRPYGNAAISGQQLPTEAPPPNQQNTQPPAGQQPPPSMAAGSYGYVNDRKFIVGDSIDGRPTGYEELVENPTGAPVKVVPLSQQVKRYASGTEKPSWMLAFERNLTGGLTMDEIAQQTASYQQNVGTTSGTSGSTTGSTSTTTSSPAGVITSANANERNRVSTASIQGTTGAQRVQEDQMAKQQAWLASGAPEPQTAAEKRAAGWQWDPNTQTFIDPRTGVTEREASIAQREQERQAALEAQPFREEATRENPATMLEQGYRHAGQKQDINGKLYDVWEKDGVYYRVDENGMVYEAGRVGESDPQVNVGPAGFPTAPPEQVEPETPDNPVFQPGGGDNTQPPPATSQQAPGQGDNQWANTVMGWKQKLQTNLESGVSMTPDEIDTMLRDIEAYIRIGGGGQSDLDQVAALRRQYNSGGGLGNLQVIDFINRLVPGGGVVTPLDDSPVSRNGQPPVSAQQPAPPAQQQPDNEFVKGNTTGQPLTVGEQPVFVMNNGQLVQVPPGETIPAGTNYYTLDPNVAPQLGQTTPEGFTPVVSAGMLRTPDGGGTAVAMPGDYIGPGGELYRWNTVTQRYELEPFAPTPITSEAEFYDLPNDVKQAILSGKPTGYFLAFDTSWLQNRTKFSGQPNTVPMTMEEFRALPVDVQRDLVEGNYFDTSYTGYAQDVPLDVINEAGRIALAPFQYPESPTSEAQFIGVPGTGTGATGLYTIPNMVTDYRMGRSFEPIEQAWTEEDTNRVFPPPPQLTERQVKNRALEDSGLGLFAATSAPTTPPDRALVFSYSDELPPAFRTAIDPVTGTLYVSQDHGQTWFEKELPSDDAVRSAADAAIQQYTGGVYSLDNLMPLQEAGQGNVNQPVQGDSGTQQPPPADGGSGSTGGSTTTPPSSETGTGNTGTQPPPAGDTGTGGSGTGVPDVDVVSYDPSVWQNLPGLQFIGGQLSREEYAALANTPIEVPALGITLPAPNQLNFSDLLFLQQYAPGTYATLSSLYRAGNQDLPTLTEAARFYAPMGQAVVPSLIQT